jgi:hypothetical protein
MELRGAAAAGINTKPHVSDMELRGAAAAGIKTNHAFQTWSFAVPQRQVQHQTTRFGYGASWCRSGRFNTKQHFSDMELSGAVAAGLALKTRHFALAAYLRVRHNFNNKGRYLPTVGTLWKTLSGRSYVSVGRKTTVR